jgi:long-chain acyl-CoA synthetase
MPFYRRVKLLRIWNGELPRTSSRKVKRQQVVAELERLERTAASAGRLREAASSSSASGADEWLYPLIAEVSQKPRGEIRPQAELVGDLGFDSLMLTELSVALEEAGIALPPSTDISAAQTVDDLRRLVASAGVKAAPASRKKGPAGDGPPAEIPVPDAVAKVGRSLLSFGQKMLYGGIFDVAISGKSFIPQNQNFLVIANHTSHLDMGLIKVVLGDQGERLTALAARDYFFDTPLKRAYFENFTNLIPMDRHGSLRESLRLAGEALNQGCNLLIFPEGTRSPSGELLEFKPILGYLALTYRVDVLPLYLQGTYEALPKGSIFPKAKKLRVRIGPALRFEDLKERTRGMARSESYRQVTALAEDAVKALRAGRVLALHPKSPAAQSRPKHRRTPSGEGGQGRRADRRRR